MTNRHLLATHKLEAFKTWLTRQGIKHRPTTADYQVLQVQLPGDPRWHAIYKKADAKLHLSAPGALIPTVLQFISGDPCKAVPAPASREQLKPVAELASQDVPWE